MKIMTMSVLVSFIVACAASNKPMQNSAEAVYLTNEAIFQNWEYNAKRPGAIRWDKEGSTFTALETAKGFKNAKLDKDQYGDNIKVYEEIVQYDPATLERTILITLKQLTPKGARKALLVDDYQWSKDKNMLLIYTNAKYVWRDKTRGEYWLLNLDDGDLWKLGGGESGLSQMMFGKFSPDGSQFAYVLNNNIYTQDLTSRDITALTSDASDSIINGLFDWAYEEEFAIQDGFRWSPDSQRIAYWQFDTHAAKDFFIINNTDTLYPEITAIPYPKVGEENSAARIGIVSVATAKTTWITLPGIAKDMYVPRMDWADSSEQILIQQMNRKQDTNTFYYANAITGDISKVFAEKEETYIELFEDPIWLESSQAFLWQSERDGWRHIYRVSRDGKTLTDLTTGDFDVTEFISVDEVNNWLYFIASPENPSQRYLYRTSLDGSAQMEQLTPTEFSGTNSYKTSSDSKWAIHTYSSFLKPPVYSLISLPDHKTRRVLEDNDELVTKIGKLALGDHEFYSVDAQDGLRLDGYLIRPPEFDNNKQYPIINFVYGEPAGQIVVDKWHSRNMWHLLMTQKGFIISSIDNRGTPSPRGRDWRRSVYGNIGPIAARDQSDALKAICKRWDYIDCEKVGVWGHSGGGSMTLNMLFRYPEQYQVGVSRAPVPDQRLYDSIYQERYSGLLSDFADNYKSASPISHAKNLKGKLLLVHGTGDDNVHYQGTERLINELIKHNRQFDFMAYPNRRHGIVEGEGTSLHLGTMQTDYFLEHLMQK
ncbi:MAG: dipeptidyl-peptidase-4 [Glaciecola sp.]|jgi:dipeptidyl-peptidase-4